MARGGGLSPAMLARYARYTQWPSLVEANFQHGVVTDTAPVNLPAGAVPNATDFLFDSPGKTRKRGGTSYQSNTLGTPPSTPACDQVLWADFTAGSKLIAVAFDNSKSQERVYDATGSSSVDAGAWVGLNQQPLVLYNDAVIQVGGNAPNKITNVAGTLTVGSWGGSPPNAYYAVNHGGYLILANTDANPNRLWFSPVPNPEATWDTSNAYIDTAAPITGLASVQGVLIVFHAGSTERVIGSIPPGTVGENMALQPLASHSGCMDVRTIQTLDGNVFFADQNGVYVTNGAGVKSVSSKPNGMGISTGWQTLAAVYGLAALAVSGTYGSDYYYAGFVSAIPADNILWVYHIPTGNWSRFKGVSIISTTARTGSSAETFAGSYGENRVYKLSDLFATLPANKSDADGTPVLPSLTTRVLGDGPSQKAFGRAHLTYDMQDAASDNPTLTTRVLVGVEGDLTSLVPESPLPETTRSTRKRFTINKRGQGVAFTFNQTAASSKTEIYALDLQVRPFPEPDEAA